MVRSLFGSVYNYCNKLSIEDYWDFVASDDKKGEKDIILLVIYHNREQAVEVSFVSVQVNK